MKLDRALILSLLLAIQSHAMVVAAAQESDGEMQADPAALKAFTEIVKAYRERPALEVKSTLKIEMAADQTQRQSSEVNADFIFGPNRKAVVKLRGFVVYLNNDEKPGDNPAAGTITAIHEKTDHSYFTGSDDGSPYYALLNAFKDLPFPELAIAIGEDSIEDVLLQLHPKALNGLTPSGVAIEEREGKSLQHITMKGENEMLDMWVDPSTKLIESIQLTMNGGAFAEQGSKVVYNHTYEYTSHDAPLPASTFAFDPAQRQRVDLMTSLVPRPARGEVAPLEGGEAPAQHALEGKPAPGFVLATADGKAVDLQDFDGRVLVLDFWASWCPPCMGALPKLHEVAKWATQQELPVNVVTVNVWEIRDGEDTPDARLESALKTWKKYNFTLPIAMDYTDETAVAYGVHSIPTTVVIRADGIVHSIHRGGGETYVDTIKRDIQDSLKALEGVPHDHDH